MQINSRFILPKKHLDKFDVLYAAELFNYYSFQCVNSKAKTIVKVCENIPFNWVYNPIWGIEKTTHKKILEIVAKKADHFIALTNKAKFALQVQGIPEEKITTIYSSIDTDYYKPIKEKRFLHHFCSLQEYSKIIFSIGRLAEEKGIQYLLYAFKKIASEYNHVYLVIGGEGKLKNELIKLTKMLNLSSRVRFVGRLADEDMVKAYNSAELTVVPSVPTRFITEQFGLTLIESMCCETPVISTFCGSIEEVVANGKTGILVPPADSEKLYSAIKFYLDHPALAKKHGQSGRKRCLEIFEKEKIAKQYANVIKKVYNRN